MKLALFNCKFSENLGDGLIAEALEAALRRQLPEVRIECCDLAGRSTYGHTTTPNRSRAQDSAAWPTGSPRWAAFYASTAGPAPAPP